MFLFHWKGKSHLSIIFSLITTLTFGLNISNSLSQSEIYSNINSIDSNSDRAFRQSKTTNKNYNHPWLWKRANLADKNNELEVSVGSYYKNNKANIEIRSGRYGKLFQAEYDCLSKETFYDNPKDRESHPSLTDFISKAAHQECLAKQQLQ